MGRLAYFSYQRFQVIYDKQTGRSRGFGFVTMSTVEEVESAAQQFNGYVSSLLLSTVLFYIFFRIKYYV